jgi:hypothetical protein
MLQSCIVEKTFVEMVYIMALVIVITDVGHDLSVTFELKLENLTRGPIVTHRCSGKRTQARHTITISFTIS